MTDDIVTRLRNKHQESSKYPKLLLSELAALNEAADEIERLRVLNAGLVEHCQWLNEQLKESENTK